MAEKEKDQKRSLSKGKRLILAGICCLLIAVSVLIYDLIKNHEAGKHSRNMLSEWEAAVQTAEAGEKPTMKPRETETKEAIDPQSSEQEPAQTDITLVPATDNPSEIKDIEAYTGEFSEEKEEKDRVVFSDMDYILLDGNPCIGVLEIPAKGLTLPVMWEWTEALMDAAPCRYSGNLYERNLIIMAHNYDNHFGRLLSIGTGEKVYFTDVYGQRFSFTITAVEVMGRSEVSKMFAGSWDMTLYTCVPQTYNRMAIRCQLEE